MEEKPETSVKLEKVDGEWTVFVVEGGEIIQQTFETKQFAKNSRADLRHVVDRQDEAAFSCARRRHQLELVTADRPENVGSRFLSLRQQPLPQHSLGRSEHSTNPAGLRDFWEKL